MISHGLRMHLVCEVFQTCDATCLCNREKGEAHQVQNGCSCRVILPHCVWEVRIRFRVLVGSVALVVGVQIGSVPIRSFRPQGNGNTAVHERDIRYLTAPVRSGTYCF